MQFQEHTKKSLMQHGVLLEDMGGDVQAVPVSALKVIIRTKFIQIFVFV